MDGGLVTRPIIAQPAGHFPRAPLTDDQVQEDVVTNLNEHAAAIDTLFSGGGGGGALNLISVKQSPYNATGDGVTDDAAAIGAALTAAMAAGLPLWFPKGTYKISSVINVAASTAVRLIGDDATIVFASVTRNALNFADSSTRVIVDGLTFTGEVNDDKDVNLGIALNFGLNVTNVHVRNCVFNYCRPVFFGSDFAFPGRLQFTNNHVNNAPLPISTSFYSIITNNWFINDESVSTRSHSIYLFGAVEGCIITGNVFRNTGPEDIQIRAGACRWGSKRNFLIEGNYFENSGEYSIWVGSDTDISGGGFNVIGNNFKNCSGCVQMQGCRDSICANNIATWDFEYAGARGAGTAISVNSALIDSTHLNICSGVIVSNNRLVQRHPYFGMITLNTLPVDGDTITVGTVTYTFRDSPTLVNEITISPGDLPETTSFIVSALAGRPLPQSLNPVLRDSTDAFSSEFVGFQAPTNVCVVASNNTFALSTTSSHITITPVVDNRDSCMMAIAVNQAMYPIVLGNSISDFRAGAIDMTNNVEPVVVDNVISGYGFIYGDGNAFSTYRGNRFQMRTPLNAEVLEHKRIISNDGFAVYDDNDLHGPQNLSNKEMRGRAGITAVGDGKPRCFLYYGKEAAVIESCTIPFRWDDGDEIQFGGTGLTTLTVTFKRSSPGALQFNDADSLLALINASTSWRAAYAPFDDFNGDPNPKMLIEIKTVAVGLYANAYMLVTTRSKTCGLSLINNYNTESYARFLGGSAGAVTHTAIFSRLASTSHPAFVQGVNATSQALAPAAYMADAVEGVGYTITHAAPAGTESFSWIIG